MKDYSNALLWLQKIPENEYLDSAFKKQVFQKLNMQEALENLCRDTFHACRSQTTLDELLAVIGKDKKEKVIQDEIDAIKQEKHFSERSVTFLLEAKQLETAAEYILQRQKKLMELVTTASRR